MPPARGARSAHHLFADRARRRARTATPSARALAERGVQTSVHYPPVHEFAIYRDPDVHLPLTEDYARRTVTLPLFAHLTHEDQDLVIEAVLEATATR